MPASQAMKTLVGFTNFQSRLGKLQDQWVAVHGISFREFLIMHHLQESPSKNLKRIDLAERVGLSASGVTRLLNPMEKIGLIAKEESARDARVSLVTLTPAGETLFTDAEKSFNERAKGFFAAMEESQRSALRELSQLRI